jgi:gamma-glutamyltranspeptidase/glutathione hydrolase
VGATLVVVLGSATAGAQPVGERAPVPGPAIGTMAMVSTAHPIATEAGLDVLRSGGNAFDAAVAIAATLNVVEPMMSGIGGYGTILTYDSRTQRVRFLNASSRIPRTVNSDSFRAPTPNYQENRRGAKAVSTPGNLHAWESLAREYGTRPWGRLLQPAIRAAEAGYVLSDRQADMIAQAYPSFPAHAQAIYGRTGRPLKAGDRLVQRDLARSLRLIVDQGAPALYGGSLGMAIDSAMRAAGGFLSIEDLRADTAEWWDAIRLEYRGAQVYTAPPPANAFDALGRLGMMARFEPRTLGHNSGTYLHRYAEVTKLGYWMRLRFAGDVDVAPPPVDSLLSPPVLDALVARIDTARATPFVPPGVTGATGSHTTHFVVADRWGNIVSATQTLGNVFGSRIMPPGTGIWLNNSLAYSTFEPKGNPMDAFPGRRKLSGDVPVIVLRDGKPWIALGTPGGHTIGQTVPQMLMNVIDFEMDIQHALSAPRISFVEPNLLLVERGIAGTVREELQRRGHNVRAVDGLGDAHGLMLEHDDADRPVRFTGGSDPRGEGLAKGLSGSRR